MPADREAVSGIELQSRGVDDLPRLSPEGDDVLRGEPEPEQPSVLGRSVALHFPDLTGTRMERAQALEDHIAATAQIRGELAELRLRAHVDLREAERRWRQIRVSGSTGPQRDERRRQADPDLAARLDDARWTIARCTEEMDRHGGSEYDAASRIYTIMSGS